MSAKKTQLGLQALYGVSVQDAIASGDAAKMSAIREQAFDYLATAQEIEALLPQLDRALASVGAKPQPLYAVSIQDATSRGDQAELARLRAEVNYYSHLLD